MSLTTARKAHAVLADIGIISQLHGKRGIFLEWQNLTQDRQEWRDVMSRFVDTHTSSRYWKHVNHHHHHHNEEDTMGSFTIMSGRRILEGERMEEQHCRACGIPGVTTARKT
jgi:DNA-binding FadR family transcriptional regulator